MSVPVFVIDTFASTAIIVSCVAWSSVVSVSVAEVTSTVFVIVPAVLLEITLPVRVNVSVDPPAVIVPIIHVLPDTVPILGEP